MQATGIPLDLEALQRDISDLSDKHDSLIDEVALFRFIPNFARDWRQVQAKFARENVLVDDEENFNSAFDLVSAIGWAEREGDVGFIDMKSSK